MARGVLMGEMLDAFRAEIRTSLDRAQSQNVADAHRYALRNAQKFLYETHDWPGLAVDRYEDLIPGQRRYSYDPVLPFENVSCVSVLWGKEWIPVEYGIGPVQYSTHEPGFRTDPVTHWRNYEVNQYEVWPTPQSAGRLWMAGKRALDRFIGDGDRCTLDDYLIVLFAAWKWLSKDDAEAAAAKEREYLTYSARLRGNQTANKRTAIVPRDVVASPGRPLRPGVDYMPSR